MMTNQPTTELATTDAPALAPYQKIHAVTGDVVDKFRYMEGHPKQYRFDAKEGVFNINGSEKLGRSFTFQPVAWRIFSDNILKMGTKNWAELFFVDEKNCVSALLFHGYSIEGLYRLIEPLYYDELTLADVVITATAEKKENTNVTPKGVYYIASFNYELADPETTQTLKAFAANRKIYRQETLTDQADVKSSQSYYNPFLAGTAADAGFLPPAGTDPETGEVIA